MDDADTRFRRMRRDCGSQDGHGDDGGPRRDAIPHRNCARGRRALARWGMALASFPFP